MEPPFASAEGVDCGGAADGGRRNPDGRAVWNVRPPGQLHTVPGRRFRSALSLSDRHRPVVARILRRPAARAAVRFFAGLRRGFHRRAELLRPRRSADGACGAVPARTDVCLLSAAGGAAHRTGGACVSGLLPGASRALARRAARGGGLRLHGLHGGVVRAEASHVRQSLHPSAADAAGRGAPAEGEVPGGADLRRGVVGAVRILFPVHEQPDAAALRAGAALRPERQRRSAPAARSLRPDAGGLSAGRGHGGRVSAARGAELSGELPQRHGRGREPAVVFAVHLLGVPHLVHRLQRLEQRHDRARGGNAGGAGAVCERPGKPRPEARRGGGHAGAADSRGGRGVQRLFLSHRPLEVRRAAAAVLCVRALFRRGGEGRARTAGLRAAADLVRRAGDSLEALWRGGSPSAAHRAGGGAVRADLYRNRAGAAAASRP